MRFHHFYVAANGRDFDSNIALGARLLNTYNEYNLKWKNTLLLHVAL